MFWQPRAQYLCLMTMPRLVFVLLACLCFLTSRSSPAHGETSPDLHPVVLVPGYTCSNLEARLTDEYQPPPGMPWCGAMKGKGWFRLWKNQTALQDPGLMPCYADQLRLVYDSAADDYCNAPGVQTRIVDFGSTRGFGSDDPAMKDMCMEKLVTTLEGLGYRDGENMFGANYDFRYAAAPPDQPSEVFNSDLSRIRDLVEHASKKNGGKPVIFVSHAFGGYLALEFLSRSPLSWRQKFIKHYLMLSRGNGGDVVILRTIASANTGPSTNVLFYANTSRSFASPLAALASPRVFGHTPLVVTLEKNYSAFEMSDLLSDLGFSDVAPRYLRRALPVTLGIRAPLVPTTTVVGVGLPSPLQLTFGDGGFGKVPQVTVTDDGDGFMNFEVVASWRTLIENDPDQRYFKLVLLPNVTHYGVVSNDFALKRLVEIVAEINQSTS